MPLLLRLCAALVCGILLQRYFPDNLIWAAALGLFGLLASVLLLRYGPAASSWCLFFAMSASGYVASQTEFETMPEYASGPHRIIGSIQERWRDSETSRRYLVEVASVDGKPVTFRLLAYAPKSEQTIPPGQPIAFTSRIRPVRLPLNPGQFDYVAYLKDKGVTASVRLEKSRLKLLPPNLSLRYLSGNILERIRTHLAASRLSPGARSMMEALILGQQQEIDATTVKAYQFSGAVHILSVSGLHVGFLAVFLQYVLGWLPRSKATEIFSLVMLLSVLWFYALLTGLSAPVLRAVTMFSCIYVGNFTGRPQAGKHALWASLLILLWLMPHALFGIGFQLSYLAVGGILWLHPPLQRFWQPRNRLLQRVRDLISVSLAAQAATLPLTLYAFHQFPGLFLITNLVIVPATGILMALCGFSVLWAWWRPLPDWLSAGNDFGIQMMNRAISGIASMDSFRWEHLYFPWPMLVGGFALLACIGWYLQEPRRKAVLSMLCAIVLLQACWLGMKRFGNMKAEILVLNDQKASVLCVRNPDETLWYQHGTPRTSLRTDAECSDGRRIVSGHWGHGLVIGKQRLIRIDSTGRYNPKLRAEIMILSGSPRINIERLIDRLHPKHIITDGTNTRTFINRCRRTCHQRKIPFHATAEKGFWKMSL